MSLKHQRIPKLLRIFIILFVILSGSVAAEKTVVTILTFNDVYDPNGADGWGNFAGLGTLLDQERATCRHSLTTVNGDFIAGSHISSFFEGAEMVHLFNMMGVDLVGIGNHEFDLGPEILKKRMTESLFTWVGSNVLDPSSQPFGSSEAYKTYQFDGIRIGFIGLCLQETVEISNPGAEVQFADIIPTAQKYVAELKNHGVDYIIAITHQSFIDDLELARRCPEISLILGGHEHHIIGWEEGRTLIFKSGSDAEYLGRIDLNMEKSEEDGTLTVIPEWKMIPNYDVAPKEDIASAIATFNQKLEDEMHHPLVWLNTPLESTHRKIRTGEAAIGNLITDVMLAAAKADIAIFNTGDIRGNRIYDAPQQLTVGDVFTELPYKSQLAIVELSGEDIWKTLENGVNNCSKGGFPQIAGAEIVWDPSQPQGQQLVEVKIGGLLLNKKKVYRVATTSYLWDGGDHYYTVKNGKLLNEMTDAPRITLLVLEYLKKVESISPKVEGRIKSVSKSVSKNWEALNLDSFPQGDATEMQAILI